MRAPGDRADERACVDTDNEECAYEDEGEKDDEDGEDDEEEEEGKGWCGSGGESDSIDDMEPPRDRAGDAPLASCTSATSSRVC